MPETHLRGQLGVEPYERFERYAHGSEARDLGAVLWGRSS